MSERADYRADRSKWQPGPWDNEPEDRREWRSSGLPCLLLRGPAGAWCGYVGLPASHPWARMYDYLPGIDVEVHGGITYGPAACHGDICHVPQPGESDDVRWVGFDCSHYQDLNPTNSYARDSTYRTVEYAAGQVEGLARQASEAAA